MSGDQVAITGSQAGKALNDWREVRASPDIQFAPVEYKEPPVQHAEPPAWLDALGKLLKRIFEPIGQFFGMSWPVVEWILIGMAVLGAAFIAWRLLAPLIEARGTKAAQDEVPEWAPDRGAALSLLEDADRLAGEGRFDEATHLLLHRSVGQIATARPDWLNPASTAREIARLPDLPERARRAFALIADRVERSFFALIPLDSDDWQAARGAYTDFALADFAR